MHNLYAECCKFVDINRKVINERIRALAESTHYSEEYFDWQKNIGAFGGVANLFKFVDYIKPTDNVIDFGCGGGYLLGNINCADKIGIEINDVAREEASKHGIKTVKSAHEIEDEWADILISNNALEHTHRPLDEIKGLLPKLKKGGRFVFIVPNDFNIAYKPGNRSQHLYSWCEMSAGNLFTTAGFKVDKVETIKHMWPPNYHKIWKRFGQRIFDIICKIYSRLYADWYQIRVIGSRPE